MAEKLKAGAANKFAEKLPEVARRIADVNDRKEKAKEYNGLAGKATKDATENLNINKTAFTFLANAKRKEPTEQIDRILTIFAGALGMGMLDQMDLFDDRLAFIKAKLGEITAEDAERKPAPGAANIHRLASGDAAASAAAH